MKLNFLLITFLLIPIFIGTSNAQWSWQNPPSHGNNLNVVSFVNENIGTSVGDNGAIIRTTDGGNSWVFQTSGTNSQLNDVSFTDANNGTTVGGSGTIIHTTDGGANWNPQTSGITTALNGVSFSDPSNGTVVGHGGVILRTTDGGNNWFSQTSGTTSILFGVSFTDVNNGIIVGGSGTILGTTDGGTNWVSQTSGTGNTLYAVSFTDVSTGTAVGFATILRTTDGGNNWVIQDYDGEEEEELLGVSFSDANNGMVVGGFEGSVILITTDGGNNWVLQWNEEQDFLRGVVCFNENAALIVGNYGLILKTTDGGNNWEPNILVTLFAVDFINQNTSVAGGKDGVIIRTTDSGENWVKQTSGVTNSFFGVDFINESTGIIVGGEGTILGTTNGGQSWETQTSGTVQSLYSVAFINENIGTICGASGTILRTTDGGNNWISQTSGTGYSLFGVSFTDANTGIIVGREGTILGTTNGGQSWETQTSGTTNYLYGVSFTDANNGMAVGNRGTVLRYNGAPTTFQLTVDVEANWNMVSVPGVNPDGQGVENWWINRVGDVYKFDPTSGYVVVTTTTPTEGYWMKHPTAQTYNTGEEWPAGGIEYISYDPINVAVGWNMIGGYDYNALVSGITPAPVGQVYGFTNSTGYFAVTELIPGYGYWLKSSATQITLPAPTFKGTSKIAELIGENWGRIIITDNAGKNYTLYRVEGDADPNSYELPPAAPDGIFDVRYGSGRYAEDLNTGLQTIQMQGITYPVKVRVEGMSITLQDATGEIVNAELTSGEEVTIYNNSINKLKVLSGEVVAPIEYALEQNYPNPFNPSTTIKFSVADASNVTLTIYNTLGQKVAELVNGKLDAGRYSYQWDASKLATGLYIYELRTNDFVSTKKMMLLK